MKLKEFIPHKIDNSNVETPHGEAFINGANHQESLEKTTSVINNNREDITSFHLESSIIAILHQEGELVKLIPYLAENKYYQLSLEDQKNLPDILKEKAYKEIDQFFQDKKAPYLADLFKKLADVQIEIEIMHVRYRNEHFGKLAHLLAHPEKENSQLLSELENIAELQRDYQDRLVEPILIRNHEIWIASFFNSRQKAMDDIHRRYEENQKLLHEKSLYQVKGFSHSIWDRLTKPSEEVYHQKLADFDRALDEGAKNLEALNNNVSLLMRKGSIHLDVIESVFHEHMSLGDFLEATRKELLYRQERYSVTPQEKEDILRLGFLMKEQEFLLANIQKSL